MASIDDEDARSPAVSDDPVHSDGLVDADEEMEGKSQEELKESFYDDVDVEKEDDLEEEEEEEESSDGENPFEQDTEKALATWIYLEFASEKVFGFIDDLAQKYVFSGQGVGLQNITIRQAWNRTVKLEKAIKQRNIDLAMSEIKTLQVQLNDTSLESGKRDEELQRQVDVFLRGVKKVQQEMRLFQIQLGELPEEERREACEPPPPSESEFGVAEQKDSKEKAKGRQQVFKPEALAEIKMKLLLELQFFRRVAKQKMKRYFGTPIKAAHFLSESREEEQQQLEFSDLYHVDMGYIMDQVNPAPRTCAFPPQKLSNQKWKRAVLDHRTAYAQTITRDKSLHFEQDMLLEKAVQSLETNVQYTSFIDSVSKMKDSYAAYNVGVFKEASADFAGAAKVYEAYLTQNPNLSADQRQDASYRLGRCYENELEQQFPTNRITRKGARVNKASSSYIRAQEEGETREWRVRALRGQAGIEMHNAENVDWKKIESLSSRAVAMTSPRDKLHEEFLVLERLARARQKNIH